MVVLDILPGVEVWVEVGGQPLQEYEDQGDNPDQGDSATRFIPAESEQHFKIGILAANTHGWKGEGLSVLVDIDGRSSKGFLLFKDRVNKKPKRLIGGGLNLAEGKMVKYKFSNLDIDTGDVFHRDTSGGGLADRLQSTTAPTPREKARGSRTSDPSEFDFATSRISWREATSPESHGNCPKVLVWSPRKL